MTVINKIFHEDCLGAKGGLKRLEDKSIDMILCDLPYGTTQNKWDAALSLEELWIQYERVIKDNGAIVLFAQTPFDKILGNSNLKLLRYEWIWEKTQATGHLNSKKMPMKAHENILVFYKRLPTYNPQITKNHAPVHNFTKYQDSGSCYGDTTKGIGLSGGGATTRFPRSVQKFSSDKQSCSLHPTQKPISLLEYLINTYTNKGDIVLDNCIGSGSTAVACINTDRSFIGFELDKGYFEICMKRLNDQK